MQDNEYMEIQQLEKAIDVLAGYCDSRSCEDCTFHTADNLCILNNCTPLEWPVHWGDDL